ncbi:response regulator transcription factor [Paraflavitalea speifideaquila]|uniref:response regulator transcription factor n=1 Tax=Paraflavitalea speifideaquila TaxID=3076558 RepID=UPI0028EF3E2D|nr:response regulator transcription factor [Paraflavitalea speifideiaquila]
MKKTIGIADDQQLFTKSLSILVNTFSGFTAVLDALNGQELLRKLEQQAVLPDIILLDVNMPVMDGVHTAERLTQTYPLIKLVALSMKDDDTTIISMLKAGCCAYLLKDIHPDELEKALQEIDTKGYYNADTANINYRRLIVSGRKLEANRLSEREMEFLQYACSELTYKQVAARMNLSERTIDGYRESVFEKLNVQSRVGMALEAIRRKMVSIH